MVAGNPQSSIRIENACRCYNDVSENEVFFSAAEIDVDPCQAKQQHGLFRCPRAEKDSYQTAGLAMSRSDQRLAALLDPG